MTWPKGVQAVAALALLAFAGLGLAVAGLRAADALDPPDLSRLAESGPLVTAADGRVLRVFPSGDGLLRLTIAPRDLDGLDPAYLAMLLAVEDRRFRDHRGVDPLALGRALVQALRSGRVRSGASTITMQLARLLNRRPRTVTAKLEEMFRAWQLERRFGKDEILAMYLTLAPYGGRIEGVRAGAHAWLGREPSSLTPGEAALLVALPQAPTRLRPDRAPAAAQAARARILARAAATGLLSPAAAERAAREPLPGRQQAVPFHAPHLARRLADTAAGTGGAGARIESSLDHDLQVQVERLLAEVAAAYGPAASAAALVVESRSRLVRAYAGGVDFHSEARAGHVDLVQAPRSPGSTLKPAIYALTFDGGLAHPDSYVRDAPAAFGGYRPRNFGGDYFGDVTLREALQLSLNVPAVHLLERLGPAAFVSRLRGAGIGMALPDDTAPGLAVGLGGVGITLQDLVSLYAALADDGQVRPLRLTPGPPRAAATEAAALFGPPARWHVAAALSGAGRPHTRLDSSYSARGIAFKTGTSYGFRDAWALGYDRDHVVGVWLGRADGTPVPAITGISAAAPALFRIFDLLPAGEPPAGRPPPGTLVADNAALPPALRRIGGTGTAAGKSVTLRFGEEPPRITFPPDRAELELRDLAGGLPLQARGGTRPLQWLVDGRPLPAGGPSRQALLDNAGPGFLEIAVVDARGRRDGVSLRLLPSAQAEPARPRLVPAAE